MANGKCERCGRCCQNMYWQKGYDYKDLPRLTNNAKTKKQIEKILVEKYERRLKRIGLPVKRIYKDEIEWNNKDKEVVIEAHLGKCKHLSFTKTGKALCLNHKKRMEECKDYFCRKAKKKI